MEQTQADEGTFMHQEVITLDFIQVILDWLRIRSWHIYILLLLFIAQEDDTSMAELVRVMEANQTLRLQVLEVLVHVLGE